MSQAPFNQAAALVHAIPAVAEWLSKAVGDLQVAERELAVTARPNYDAICFHAQQAAEKLMKAFLEAKGHRPPKVHDLVHLDTLLRRIAPAWSFSISELSNLSSSAVESRYPGTTATRVQAEEAMDIATRLWVALRPLV